MLASDFSDPMFLVYLMLFVYWPVTLWIVLMIAAIIFYWVRHRRQSRVRSGFPVQTHDDQP